MAIGFLVPVALIAALGFISHHLATETVESFNWVTHTYDVIQEIDGAQAALVNVETGQRGYTITGRETYLESHRNTVAEITNRLARIHELVRDKPVQLTNLMELATFAGQKVARAELVISIRQREGFEAAQQLMAGDEGKILMDKVRHVAAMMRAQELRLLDMREDKYRLNASRVQFCALAFVAAALAVLAIVVFLLVRVQRLQALVATAAWTEHVDRGGEGASFELYLKDRLGKKTEEGVPAETVLQITRELEAWAKKKSGK